MIDISKLVIIKRVGEASEDADKWHVQEEFQTLILEAAKHLVNSHDMEGEFSYMGSFASGQKQVGSFLEEFYSECLRGYLGSNQIKLETLKDWKEALDEIYKERLEEEEKEVIQNDK